MYYVKRGLIVLVALLILGVAFLPWWTTSMAEKGFENPKDPLASSAVKKAVQIKMAIYLYKECGRICQKAIEKFPDSKDRPYFIYTASICAQKNGFPKEAIKLLEQYLDEYPEHMWRQQALARLRKLKALYEEDIKNQEQKK